MIDSLHSIFTISLEFFLKHKINMGQDSNKIIFFFLSLYQNPLNSLILYAMGDQIQNWLISWFISI